MGIDTIPYTTMDYILDALSLDDETLWQAFKGAYTAAMYDMYVRTIPKNRLMPPAIRK